MSGVKFLLEFIFHRMVVYNLTLMPKPS